MAAMHSFVRSTLLRGAVGAALFLAACGSSEPAPARPTAAPAPAADPTAAPAPAEAQAAPVADGDAAATCRQAMTRMRECTDLFIPSLVGLRVELDVPAGIAAQDKAQGRDALVAQAKEEWKVDSTDEGIANQCTKMTGSMSADQLAQMIDAVKGCIAKVSCEQFVSCIEPVQRQHLAAQKAAEAK